MKNSNLLRIAFTATLLSAFLGWTDASHAAATEAPNVAVGPQYDTTHVYVRPEDFDRFVASLVADLWRHHL